MDYKVDLRAARQILGGSMAFGGNLNPGDLLLQGSPADVRAAAAAAAIAAGPEPGYILMPGCDLPPATPWENIMAFTRQRAS
jgi:uroporphyrinogen decarboxylase